MTVVEEIEKGRRIKRYTKDVRRGQPIRYVPTSVALSRPRRELSVLDDDDAFNVPIGAHDADSPVIQIPTRKVNKRDILHVAAFHAFYRAAEGSLLERFAQAIVKSSDDRLVRLELWPAYNALIEAREVT